ncbi:MAG: hypothetical protein Kow0029_03320 [Candidatus Rifleibacteriota bacterium]
MSKDKIKGASFGRLLMLFAAILLSFLALTSHHTLLKLANESEKQFKQKLVASIDNIFARTAEESFLFDRFQNLMDVMNQNGIDSKELATLFQDLEINHKTLLEAYFYRNDEFVKAFNSTPEEIVFFKSLMKNMALEGEAFNKAQREMHRGLMQRFGPGHRLELMKNDFKKVWRFRTKGKDNFFYWQRFDNGNALFIIARDYPDFIGRIEICKKKLNALNFGAGDPKSGKYSLPYGISADQMLAAKIKAGLSGTNSVQAFNRIWTFVEDETGCFYTIASEKKPEPSFTLKTVALVFNVSTVIAIIFVLLYLFSLLHLYPGQNFADWLDSTSIRFRILALFAMASVFPVLFTVLIGATSLSDRVEIIENQVIGESISNLNRLENMVSEKLEAIDRMCTKIRNDLKTQSASEEFLCKRLQDFDIPRYLSRLEVRDGAGKILFTTDDEAVHGVTEAMSIFSRIALKLHAPNRMGKSANLVTPAEVVSESVLSTDEIGMATILRQRGKRWRFRMGTFPTIWYWDVYPELATGPAFMHFTTQLIAVYQDQIDKTLQKQEKASDNIQLRAELNSQYCDFNLFPKIRGIDEKTLLNASIVAMKTGKVVFRETVFHDIPYWITIKAEKQVGSHVLLNLISKPKRLSALTPLKTQLIAGGVLALIVSLFGAMLLTRLIIYPIGDIAAGINAIRERKHEFRIPVRRKDEFGALAVAFNNVIAELKELEYGRIVQTSLLPHEIYVPDGYDLACFRASATDLAGDYHDVLPLDDGKTAIILGDVTGHGISAALAMAMAKATVDYMGMAGNRFPGPLMDQLNSLFNRELKPRHKFMTLVTLVLDPATGILQIDNAGQSYPFYYDAEKKSAREIPIPSMPLGASKKRRSKPISVEMKSGDAIILYSDGIIECSSSNGEMFGYDRMKDTYIRLVESGKSSNEILTEMIRALDEFRKPGPYPDDVTLVLLRKL